MSVTGSETTERKGELLGIKYQWWAVGCAAVALVVLILCICLVLVLLLAYGPRTAKGAEPAKLESETPDQPTSEPLPLGSPVGQVAPDFTLKDLNGRTITLSELRGHPVLINFWATWCPPCREEMPVLQTMWTRYRDQGFVLLAIDVQEPPNVVESFVRRQGLDFYILLDTRGDVSTRYRIRGFPTSFFVDREGVIRAYHPGSMDESTAERYIKRIVE